MRIPDKRDQAHELSLILKTNSTAIAASIAA
jgi:hypothetical protein